MKNERLQRANQIEVFIPNTFSTHHLPHGITGWGNARGMATGSCQYNERTDMWTAQVFFFEQNATSNV